MTCRFCAIGWSLDPSPECMGDMIPQHLMYISFNICSGFSFSNKHTSKFLYMSIYIFFKKGGIDLECNAKTFLCWFLA